MSNIKFDKTTTRYDVLRILYDMANRLSTSYSAELDEEMWDLCSEWNSAHYGTREEICLFESEDTDGNDIFCIEDDYWHYPEED